MSINSFSSVQSILNKKAAVSAPSTTPLIKYTFNGDLSNSGSAGSAYNGVNNNLTFTTSSPSPSTSVNNYSIYSTNGGTSSYQYFKIPAMSSIINTSKGVSVCFWFSGRGNTSGDGGMACFGAGSNGTQYASAGGTPVTTLHCVTNGTQVTVNLSFSSKTKVVSYNTWHHLALIMDIIGATPKYSLYIDGVAIASNIAYDNSVDSYTYLPTFSDFWSIGAIINSHGWGQFLGAFADFRIYNLQLSSTQINSIYNNLL